ncbi:hypothetical protein O3M35_000722 [Rhynocoris fuscipes]|uniref:Uncharacterized protein n=1 Tax=Rhynocoris fuscipes TaxID=488301 RepID=A0AAW1DMR1_9HEMI
MGITTIDEILVSSVKNWRAAVDGERKASLLWNEKWGWIVDEYRLTSEDLVNLRSKRDYEATKKIVDSRTTFPFPVTTSQDYGWLSTKPEFKLDKFGPYPRCICWNLPVEPPEYQPEKETDE